MKIGYRCEEVKAFSSAVRLCNANLKIGYRCDEVKTVCRAMKILFQVLSLVPGKEEMIILLFLVWIVKDDLK